MKKKNAIAMRSSISEVKSGGECEMKMIRCSKHRFTLEYHYLGNPVTRKSEFICMTLLDAINQTLDRENWRPIVFDAFIEEDE